MEIVLYSCTGACAVTHFAARIQHTILSFVRQKTILYRAAGTTNYHIVYNFWQAFCKRKSVILLEPNYLIVKLKIRFVDRNQFCIVPGTTNYHIVYNFWQAFCKKKTIPKNPNIHQSKLIWPCLTVEPGPVWSMGNKSRSGLY